MWKYGCKYPLCSNGTLLHIRWNRNLDSWRVVCPPLPPWGPDQIPSKLHYSQMHYMSTNIIYKANQTGHLNRYKRIVQSINSVIVVWHSKVIRLVSLNQQNGLIRLISNISLVFPKQDQQQHTVSFQAQAALLFQNQTGLLPWGQTCMPILASYP